MVPFERAMVVSYRLSIVTVALSLSIRPQFAIECFRRSNQQSHFGAKFGEEGVDRCKPNFNRSWERHRAVVCIRKGVDSFCSLSTMHERDRQTDRQTDHRKNGNADRNRRNRLSAMSAKSGSCSNRLSREIFLGRCLLLILWMNEYQLLAISIQFYWE